MYEIYTTGGGEFIVDILNGVSAMVGGDSYVRAMEISGLVALFTVMVRVAFGGEFKQTAIWIVSFTVLYNVLMLPKSTVQVVDTINPTLPAATVANVPFGLAFTASTISEIGYKLTSLSEQAFSLPDDLKYQNTGMVFGSKLLAKTTEVKIIDSEFGDNMNEFMMNCVFYDLMLYRYDFDALIEAPDIWEFLTVTNFQSSIRGIFYRTGSSSVYKTCNETAALLSPLWTAQIDKASKLYSPRLYPSQDPAAAKTLMLSQLPVAHEYLLNASRDASSILKQNMMINAIWDGMKHFSATTGSAAGLQIYSDSRAKLQSEASYKSIGRTAGEQVERLKVVFEAIYYGSFPFIFLLMLWPEGFKFFKTYMMGLIWLQLWGPMNAILNRLMMGGARDETLGLSYLTDGSNAIAFVTQAGIDSVYASVASTAGFIASSIPFLAMFLVKGISSFGSLATSYMGVSHGAASQAAGEATTGNVSLGNASLDNQSYNNISANRQVSAGYMDTETTRMMTSSGTSFSRFGDGSTTMDRSATVSNLGEYGIKGASAVSGQLTSQASEYRSVANTASENYSQSMASAYSSAADMAKHINQSEASGIDYRSSLSSDQKEAVENVTNHIDKFSQQEGLSEKVSNQMLASASAGLSFKGMKASLGGDVSTGAASTESYSKALDYINNNNLSDSFSVVSSISENKNFNRLDSEASNYSDSIRSSLDESQRYARDVSQAETKAAQYSEMASKVSSNSVAFDKNMANEFMDWGTTVAKDPGNSDYLLGDKFYGLMNRNDRSAEHHKENMINEFVEYKASQLVSNVSDPTVSSNNTIATEGKSAVNEFHSLNSTNMHKPQAKVDNSDLGEVMAGSYIQNLNKIDSAKNTQSETKETVNKELDDSWMHSYNTYAPFKDKEDKEDK